MTNIRAQGLLTVFICFGTCWLCLPASGQSPPPDSAELIEALKPKAKTRELNLATAPAERDRVEKRKKIIDLLRKKGTRGLSVEDRTDLPEVVSDRPSVDMEIYFDYNSAAITDQARPTLSSLGRALQAKELKGQNFLLAGHTDATGGPDYNQDLSQRRAVAVKNYLIQNFGVSESELVATGFGEDQLKIPNDPAAAQNRRVQVINVGE